MLKQDSYRRTEVTVEGRGGFPLDMLRYDSCVPQSETDALTMNHEGDLRRVHLHRFSVDGKRASAARWESFRWRVVQDTGRP